jgi:hypothetical protein
VLPYIFNGEYGVAESTWVNTSRRTARLGMRVQEEIEAGDVGLCGAFLRARGMCRRMTMQAVAGSGGIGKPKLVDEP